MWKYDVGIIIYVDGCVLFLIYIYLKKEEEEEEEEDDEKDNTLK